MTAPVELDAKGDALVGKSDDVFITSASWEARCLGVPRLLGDYRATKILIAVYDGVSARREEHIREMRELFDTVGSVSWIPASHADPLGNVRQIVRSVRETTSAAVAKVSIDISTFTRKHLLQLLQGLELNGMLGDCRFYYTEPRDYDTLDNEPISQGITSVRAIETFAGHNAPSKDSLLVLFLGYEGRRAEALWEHFEPNVTIAVIPDPPYHAGWNGRTELQNRYLLSCLPAERVFRTHSRDPVDTENLLNELVQKPEFSLSRYNYRIAPFGTKCQLLGIYRFLRRHRGVPTLVYARPVRYLEERAATRPGRSWLVDNTAAWLAP